MNRLMIQAVLFFILCPLLVAQQPRQAAPPSATAQPAPAEQQPADVPQSAVAERNQAIRSARTLCIHSGSAFITVSTFDRALMKQKNWDQLGLNIVASPNCQADLQIDVNRLIFTHIHTYVLTDMRSDFVLASGRVTAVDGIVASGPMAEQIVKILSTARLPGQAAGTGRGF